MRTVLLCLFCLPFVSACSLVGDDDRQLVDLGIETEEEYRDERARMIGALEDAIGEARAADVSSCAVVNVGTKACGGPAEFRVYSTTDGDTDRILELAEEITDLDAEANMEFGLVSTCDVPVAPRPVLAEGRCAAEGFRTSAR
ncbi:MAG: hypothetical protein Rubg2KO_13880 [Rubricoccaceae bacterium]